MSNDRKQVLDMLAAGKITSEEADRLLEKLGQSPPPPSGGSATDGQPRYLRVLVDSSDGDKVNIRVPLALVRTGLALKTMMPQGASDKLSEKGIDLAQLNGLEGDDLMEALRELQVDIDTTGGDAVRIFCE